MNPPFLTGGLAAPHGFFTRAGGMSEGGYASLNGSLSGGDDRAHVLANRARVAAMLGLAPTALLGVTQVHGATVVTVETPWAMGQGSRADAMVTDRAGIGLCIITADCAPVLFSDAAGTVVGAAHAGWRGAVGGVLEATVAAMRTLGATGISSCIGPCIGLASYEVGEEVLREAGSGAASCFATLDGRLHFDLGAYCALRLAGCGVRATRIAADTYAEPERFFSHRRRTHAGGGVIGHQMSAIRCA